jgi:AcrR family transcriptional regulator
MSTPVKQPKRAYKAPRRAAAAAQTRETILDAAKARFESRGWAGTTIPAIADDAGVSPKTIEALFGTKAALLTELVDYAIRGDTADTPMIRREAALAVEGAPDARTMIERHAAYSNAITSRSAAIASVVESAAASDERVAKLWERMTHNRRFGARWAAEILMRMGGRREDLTLEEAERIFLVAIDWGTFRTLTAEAGMSSDDVRRWIERYYRRMLLA